MLRLAAVLCVSFVACLPRLAHAQERRLPVLSANLDALLNFAVLWQWSSEDFEKAYVVKLADPEQQEKPPQFEWVNTTKERARFSRKMYSNVDTKLTMFGGSIRLEEAIVEFVNGNRWAASRSISLKVLLKTKGFMEPTSWEIVSIFIEIMRLTPRSPR